MNAEMEISIMVRQNKNSLLVSNSGSILKDQPMLPGALTIDRH